MCLSVVIIFIRVFPYASCLKNIRSIFSGNDTFGSSVYFRCKVFANSIRTSIFCHFVRQYFSLSIQRFFEKMQKPTKRRDYRTVIKENIAVRQSFYIITNKTETLLQNLITTLLVKNAGNMSKSTHFYRIVGLQSSHKIVEQVQNPTN